MVPAAITCLTVDTMPAVAEELSQKEYQRSQASKNAAVSRVTGPQTKYPARMVKLEINIHPMLAAGTVRPISLHITKQRKEKGNQVLKCRDIYRLHMAVDSAVRFCQ